MNRLKQAPTTYPKIQHIQHDADSLQSSKTTLLKRLSELGLSRLGAMKSESRYLPYIIHPNEHVGGIIYGHDESGTVMLIATDRRVVYLDRKPLFIKSEELSYDVVAGVTIEWLGFAGTLTLHTRLGEIKIRVYNRKAADIFHAYVEERCINQQIHFETERSWS